MLDHIRHISIAPGEADPGQSFVEQSAGGTDEGVTEFIFFVAGLLAYKQDSGARGTFPENGLRSVLPKIAAPAGGSGRAQFG
jgi:hypothetical protein